MVMVVMVMMVVPQHLRLTLLLQRGQCKVEKETVSRIQQRSIRADTHRRVNTNTCKEEMREELTKS